MAGRARVSGPLASFADGFRAELDRRGYTPASRECKVNQMAHLSRWLEAEGLGAADLNGERVVAFLAVFGVTRKQAPTLWAMRPLLEWLRAEGVIGAEPEALPGPSDVLMADYRQWMADDRGLAERTMGRYETTARRFLAGRAHATAAGTGIEGVTGEAVTSFLLAEVARGVRLGSLQGRVAELRSLLRFLYVAGLTESALAEAVPPVPGWKQTRVPPRMAAADVNALVASCDPGTATGKRDLAMLLLLARLGLRAAEVIGLELDDLDWRAGELVVAGKGRRQERMPLPRDVGEAVIGYVTGARPRVQTRTVFLTVAAPPRPLAKNTLSQMVWRQCARAGLAPVRAHRLRHALASDLLDRGATLREIGQVLRHRDLATTAVYAKVDHARLRELALPWPVTR
jgi:integrase/recombinase XerD